MRLRVHRSEISLLPLVAATYACAACRVSVSPFFAPGPASVVGPLRLTCPAGDPSRRPKNPGTSNLLQIQMRRMMMMMSTSCYLCVAFLISVWLVILQYTSPVCSSPSYLQYQADTIEKTSFISPPIGPFLAAVVDRASGALCCTNPCRRRHAPSGRWPIVTRERGRG
jgi:hypothetical protein